MIYHMMVYCGCEDGGDVYICPVCGREVLVVNFHPLAIFIRDVGDDRVTHKMPGPTPKVEPLPPEFEAWGREHQDELGGDW